MENALVVGGCGNGCWVIGGELVVNIILMCCIYYFNIQNFSILEGLIYRIKNRRCNVEYIVKWCDKIIKQFFNVLKWQIFAKADASTLTKYLVDKGLIIILYIK